MSKRTIFHRELLLLSGGFFFVFLGPGAIQQHLDKIVGDKRFYALATLYGSFCFWRVFIGATIDRLGDLWSGLLGAATYVAFAAAVCCSTSWAVVLGAAALWGWGAASFWISSQAQVLDATTRYGASSGFLYSVTAGGQMLGVGLLTLLAVSWRPDWPLPRGRMLAAACVVLGLPGLVLLWLVPRRRAARQRFSLGGFWAVARRRPIVLAGVVQLCSSLSYGILLGAFSELARQRTGGQWPAVAFYVMRVGLAFPGGVLGDRIGKDRVMKLGFLTAAGGVLVAALWRSGGGLALGLCAAALAVQNTLTAASSMALMGDVAPPRTRHFALGAVFLWRDLGVAVPLLLAGALKGLLPDPQDAQATEAIFRVLLLVFAGVFVASAFLCDALRRAIAGHR